MTSALDMALDDLIKNNKKQSGGVRKGRNNSSNNNTNTNTNRSASRGGRRSGGGSGRRNGGTALGPVRKITKRPGSRPSFSVKTGSRAPDGQWEHDMFEEGASAASRKPGTGIETGTKLFISNLEYGVSNEDIKELFSEIGDLKRSTVHYDRSGRSKGTAEVVFSRRVDAVAALKRYNNVQLDGKPMKIEIIGTNLSTPAAPNRPKSSAASVKTAQGSRGVKPPRGRGKKVRGRSRGKGPEKSAADLDAELDTYHNEAMQES